MNQQNQLTEMTNNHFLDWDAHLEIVAKFSDEVKCLILEQAIFQ